MSNVGQGVLAVAGAVIGFYVGGPAGAAYGFQLGLTAGSVLFPTQLPGVTGPRLDDLRTTTSILGSPVCIVYGTIAVPGTVMYLGDLVETSHTESVGGKGAPEQDQTTFTYSQSIAIGLCEGPIGGVIRIWENGELVFDIRPQQDGESSVDYANRLTMSASYSATFTIYTGTEDQEPDPTIELEKGVGNVPAFRGLAYVVYANRALQDDQGRRHPNFKFEVSTCTGQFQSLLVFTESGTWVKPAQLESADVLAIGGGAGGSGGELVSGLAGGGDGGGGGGASFASFTVGELPASVDVIVGQGGDGGAGAYPDGSQFGEAGEDGGDSSFGDLVIAGGGSGAGAGGNGNLADGGAGGVGASTAGLPGQSTNTAPTGSKPYGIPAGAGGGAGGGLTQFGVGAGGDGGSGEPDTDIPPGAVGGHGSAAAGFPGATQPVSALDGQAGEASIINHGGGGGGGGGAAAADNPYPRIGGGGGGGGRFGGGGGGGGASNGAFTGMGRAGDGGPGANGCVIVAQNFGSADPCAASRTLASIVSNICARVGLTDALIDVTDLEQVEVDGYAITRVMPARAAIDPLRSIGFFDVSDSQGRLKFVTRGKPHVATLDADDLGAGVYGDELPEPLTVIKAQDPELPRTVRVHYLAPSRDYEPGEQKSPARVTTDAVNDVDVELAIAADDDTMAQVAEVLWSDAWQSRWSYETALDAAHWLMLDDADAIRIPVDRRLMRVRIVRSTQIGPTDIRQVTLCRDDDGAYVSEAVGSTPERTPNSITFRPPTDLVLLDLPALRDADNDAGFYAAAGPAASGKWSGCVIARSTDGGVSYGSPLVSITSAATLGRIVTPPGAGITTTWDTANEIVVDITSGTLESRPESDVLLGANAAAIGAHGRWNIVQFADASLVSPGRYRLTRLLQGRRGTESNVGTVLESDRFVLISGEGIVRIPLESAQIGAIFKYRATTIGTNTSAGVAQDFVGAGQALETFSPVYLAATREINGDVTFTWTRRARLSQELRSGVDIPLFEASESYEVDIYDGDDVVRTLTSTVQSATYTAAQQATDFGSPLPATYHVKVYQMSAIVGRGTPGDATL